MRGVLISPYRDVSAAAAAPARPRDAAVLVDRFSDDGRFSSVSVDSVSAAGWPSNTSSRPDGVASRSSAGRSTSARSSTGWPAPAWPSRTRGATFEIEVIATAAMTVAEGAAAGARDPRPPAEDWPDALFAANDLLAIGLLQALIVTAMRVPDEIAIIGFDDIAFASAAVVPLSSMRQPSR